MPIVRLSPSGPELDIDTLEMPAPSLAGRPRDGVGTAQAEVLTPDQSVQVLTAANIVVQEWDFDGVIDASGVLAVPGWAAFQTPVISQRDTGAGHSANHPGQLNLNLDAAAADQSCIFIGPWDFSVITRFGASVLIPSAGGNELANMAFGFGIVQNPLLMDPLANGGIWDDNNLVGVVRSAGAGPGTWLARRDTAASGAATQTGVAVALDTWYTLDFERVSPGVWRMMVKFGSTVVTSVNILGVLTSGIAFLGIGGIRTAAAAGRNIVVDRIRIETSALDRQAA